MVIRCSTRLKHSERYTESGGSTASGERGGGRGEGEKRDEVRVEVVVVCGFSRTSPRRKSSSVHVRGSLERGQTSTEWVCTLLYPRPQSHGGLLATLGKKSTQAAGAF
jgi:hypothetical protein